MKKFTEILSFVLTLIFVLGGLFLAIVVIGALMELFCWSPSNGLEELLGTVFMPFIIIGMALFGKLALSAIFGGVTAFKLIKTANKRFDGEENRAKRIILKCIAYGILIAITAVFAKFFT